MLLLTFCKGNKNKAPSNLTVLRPILEGIQMITYLERKLWSSPSQAQVTKDPISTGTFKTNQITTILLALLALGLGGD